jgi:hypothetical protein
MSGCFALRQSTKPPKLYVPSFPGAHQSVVAPPSVTSSTATPAAQLTKIEQQTEHVAHPNL